jgi:hypothetical protein
MSVRGGAALALSAALMMILPASGTAQGTGVQPAGDEYSTSCPPGSQPNGQGICVEAGSASGQGEDPGDGGGNGDVGGRDESRGGSVPVSDNGGTGGATHSGGRLPYTGAGLLGILALIGIGALATGAVVRLGQRALKRAR